MKIAVCVHLFYTDMFDEIVGYLKNIKHPYDLYISLVRGFYKDCDIKKIKEYNNQTKIIIVENKGVDIGGFLNVFKVIDDDTDLILKIHTKKGIGSEKNPSSRTKKYGVEKTLNHGKNWFKQLMEGVLFDEKKVNQILNKFNNDKNCGMVGYRLFNNSTINKNEIIKLIPLFKLDESYLKKNFIGGTIFWVRYQIIKKYFTDDIIKHIMDNTKDGYVIEPSIIHAIERIFGYLVEKENQKIFVI